MVDKASQEEEIAALKSIYEEEDILAMNKEGNCGSYYVKLTPPLNSTHFNVNMVDEKKMLRVEHLPPVVLNFELPEDYPSKQAPRFSLQCRWLSVSDLEKLCTKLDELWIQCENQLVLFTWISFLNDELFDHLSHLDACNLKVTNQAQTSVTDLNENTLPSKPDETSAHCRAIKLDCSHDLLVNYDRDQRRIQFERTEFMCKICFTEKKGIECMQFRGCDHVFCTECMRGYFESQIKSGDVKALTCPQEKCDSQAIPAQVLDIVGFDMFNRYDSLLLKDSLNSMEDIIYCPRPNCQCPVIPEETLGRCPDCKFSFCTLCRQSYHGTIEPCKISPVELKEICEKYKNGTAQDRSDLVKRYGETRIRKAIEEQSSMDLIRETSKQCPNCKSWMQKLDGCNKMTCTKCRCYFCWLCMQSLSKSDPYGHFSNMNSACFSRLFEGMLNNEWREQPDDDSEDDDDDDDDDNQTDIDDDDDDLNEIVFLDSDPEYLEDIIAQV